MSFIDEHRSRFGVEPICRTLEWCVSSYYARKTRPTSRRQLEDERLLSEIRRVHSENYEAYGARRVWRQLAREGICVGRCRVERLMRAHAIRGAQPSKRRRCLTVADAAAERPIRDHLVPNFVGFELLPAPYTIAHLKLTSFYGHFGYALTPDECLSIYLANSLELSEIGPCRVGSPSCPALSRIDSRPRRITTWSEPGSRRRGTPRGPPSRRPTPSRARGSALGSPEMSAILPAHEHRDPPTRCAELRATSRLMRALERVEQHRVQFFL